MRDIIKIEFQSYRNLALAILLYDIVAIPALDVSNDTIVREVNDQLIDMNEYDIFAIFVIKDKSRIGFNFKQLRTTEDSYSVFSHKQYIYNSKNSYILLEDIIWIKAYAAPLYFKKGLVDMDPFEGIVILNSSTYGIIKEDIQKHGIISINAYNINPEEIVHNLNTSRRRGLQTVNYIYLKKDARGIDHQGLPIGNNNYIILSSTEYLETKDNNPLLLDDFII